MAHLSRLTIVGATPLFALVCNMTAGAGPAAMDIESTVVARVNATLTAEAQRIAANHVTETVVAAEGLATQAAQSPPPATAMPAEPTVTAGPAPTSLMPVIAYFTCAPCVVEPGGAATLSWDLSEATAAYLDGEGVTASGSAVVYPDQTTTYQLVAVNANGQSEMTVTVEVRGLPTIHYFTCLPCEVSKGQQSTLSWDLGGATAAYLDGEGVTAPGSIVVAPDQTTTYRLVAVSERGSVERLTTVTVKEGGDPEAVSEALNRLGYDVRSVGYLPLAAEGNTISVIMATAVNPFQSQEIADQYFGGFKALYDNYPGQVLTVGLYDGTRYVIFVTAKSSTFEAMLRGEMDGQDFWQAATWNIWDEWTGRWLRDEAMSFSKQDFASKSFGF